MALLVVGVNSFNSSCHDNEYVQYFVSVNVLHKLILYRYLAIEKKMESASVKMNGIVNYISTGIVLLIHFFQYSFICLF